MKSIIALFIVAVSACSVKDGEPVEFSSACSPERNGKYVELTGFIDPGVVIRCSPRTGVMHCGMDLHETPKAYPGDPRIYLYVPEGDGPNSVSRPDHGYKQEAVRTRDNSGKYVSYQLKSRVTGRMMTVDEPMTCAIEVKKITQ